MVEAPLVLGGAAGGENSAPPVADGEHDEEYSTRRLAERLETNLVLRPRVAAAQHLALEYGAGEAEIEAALGIATVALYRIPFEIAEAVEEDAKTRRHRLVSAGAHGARSSATDCARPP